MSTMGEVFESTIIPKRPKKSGASALTPTLTIISHPNPARMGNYALLHGLAKGNPVEISRVAPLFKPPDRALGSPLSDPFISREPIHLSAKDGHFSIDPGSGKIPVRIGNDGTDGALHFSPRALDRGVVLTLAERVILLFHWTREEIKPTSRDHGLVGHGDKILFLRQEIERVGDLATPVLLRGASGTGKELVARAIHQAGRPGKPFVSVNMGAIPPSLAASELFGAIKGSFTGSNRNQVGYFKAAHGGTLFLDEIGEASPEVQVMLLRALETGEISPVGAQSSIMVKTRLITATDANLEAKMAEDSFKTPLFHRLAGYEINLPRLTERLEDFGRLFHHFALDELKELGEQGQLSPRGSQEEPWLPAPLMARLLNYDWPGNIRQLKNTVRQLLIGCRGAPVLHLVPKLEQMLLAESGARAPAEPSMNAREKLEQKKRRPSSIKPDELFQTLKEEQWDVKAAANRLTISRGALYLLIEKTPGLQKASDLDADRILARLEQQGGDVVAAAEKLRVSVRALRRRMNRLGLS